MHEDAEAPTRQRSVRRREDRSSDTQPLHVCSQSFRLGDEGLCKCSGANTQASTW